MHASRFEAVAPQIVKTSGFREVSGLIRLRLLKIIPHCFFTLWKISNILIEKIGRWTPIYPITYMWEWSWQSLFFSEVVSKKSQVAFHFTTYSSVSEHSFLFPSFLLFLENPNGLMHFSYSKTSRGSEEILHISSHSPSWEQTSNVYMCIFDLESLLTIKDDLIVCFISFNPKKCVHTVQPSLF